jgi:hypothetical protein
MIVINLKSHWLYALLLLSFQPFHIFFISSFSLHKLLVGPSEKPFHFLIFVLYLSLVYSRVFGLSADLLPSLTTVSTQSTTTLGQSTAMAEEHLQAHEISPSSYDSRPTGKLTTYCKEVHEVP